MKKFNEENFKNWAITQHDNKNYKKPEIYKLNKSFYMMCNVSDESLQNFNSVIDHAFLVNQACLWHKDLEGVEFVIIARIYNDEIVKNPPDGLKIIELPKSKIMWSNDDTGTPIAITINKINDYAILFMNICTTLPAMLFPAVLPSEFNDRYNVTLELNKYPAFVKSINKR